MFTIKYTQIGTVWWIVKQKLIQGLILRECVFWKIKFIIQEFMIENLLKTEIWGFMFNFISVCHFSFFLTVTYSP